MTNKSPWSPGPIKESVFKSRRTSRRTASPCWSGRAISSRGETAARSIGAAAPCALQLDVTDQASIAAAAERIRKEFGRLDVLINNAAISNTGKRPGMSVEEYSKLTRPSNVSLDEVRAVWETNVFGVLAVYQAMLPLLREAPEARIVNVSSGAGSLAMNSDPAYPWRVDLRPRLLCVQDGPQRYDARHGDRTGAEGIKVNAISPGFTKTNLNGLCGHADGRGGRPRGGARCAARAGRPNRQVHALGKRNDPVVM